MQAPDRFVIAGRDNFEVNSYEDSVLSLASEPGIDVLGETVSVQVPMTQAEHALFLGTEITYLSGGVFISPGQAAPCFTRSTMIATPAGEIPVERLRVGDLGTTRSRSLSVGWGCVG